MIVCICNAVSDKDILHAAKEGAAKVEDLSERLNLGTCCGTCKDCATACLRKAINTLHDQAQEIITAPAA